MNRIAISLCSLFVGVFTIFANTQSRDIELKNKVALSGELLSCDTWQVEASYHYFFCPYIGFGGSVGHWKQYVVNGIPSGRGWTIAEKYENVQNFFIHPSVNLVSPRLARFNDTHIHLFLETGVQMNIPYGVVNVILVNNKGTTIDYKKVSTNKGRWYAIDYKAGIYFTFGDVGCSAGYVHSNLDIFGMRRNMVYDGKLFDTFYPKRKNPYGCFISLFYLF